jgi:AP-3 complex subunit sigma
MIRAIIIINDSGQPRLVRWYDSVPISDRAGLIRRIFLLVSRRGDSQCNFLDVTRDERLPGTEGWASGTRLVYRHYATLFFVFVCEETESELGILDLIQVFVETLDRCFESVCELDLIFHANKVHQVLDEIVQGGLVLETNMIHVLRAVDDLSRLEKESMPKSGTSAMADLTTASATTAVQFASNATAIALASASAWWQKR